MKKLLLVFLLLSISCSSTKEIKPIPEDYVAKIGFLGRLGEKDIQFFKENYNWAQGEVLVVNFRQPRSACHFDNSGITRGSKKWWEEFYRKVNRHNFSNIYVFSESHLVKSHLDNEIFFADKDGFLLENFFSRENSCFAVLVLNEAGEYLQYNGHYQEWQVARFIDVLSQSSAEPVP